MFHLNSEVGISKFPVGNFNLEHPLKSDFRLGKSGEPHQPRPRKPLWLLCACVKAVVMYCLLALLSHLWLITHSRPTVQPLSVDTVFVCANYCVMHCYQLVLLTMAKVNPPISMCGCGHHTRPPFRTLAGTTREVVRCEVVLA